MLQNILLSSYKSVDILCAFWIFEKLMTYFELLVIGYEWVIGLKPLKYSEFHKTLPTRKAA